MHNKLENLPAYNEYVKCLTKRGANCFSENNSHVLYIILIIIILCEFEELISLLHLRTEGFKDIYHFHDICIFFHILITSKICFSANGNKTNRLFI